MKYTLILSGDMPEGWTLAEIESEVRLWAKEAGIDMEMSVELANHDEDCEGDQP